MRNPSLLAALVALFVASLTFATADARGGSGPVFIASCTIANSGGYVPKNSGVEIVWNNMRRQPLTRVVFRVRYRGIEQDVTDAGSFTQGAKIDHKYDAFAGATYQGPNPNVCHVLSATYEDGRTVRPSY